MENNYTGKKLDSVEKTLYQIHIEEGYISEIAHENRPSSESSLEESVSHLGKNYDY